MIQYYAMMMQYYAMMMQYYAMMMQYYAMMMPYYAIRMQYYAMIMQYYAIKMQYKTSLPHLIRPASVHSQFPPRFLHFLIIPRLACPAENRIEIVTVSPLQMQLRQIGQKNTHSEKCNDIQCTQTCTLEYNTDFGIHSKSAL